MKLRFKELECDMRFDRLQHSYYELANDLPRLDILFRNLKVSFDIDGVEADSAKSALNNVNTILGSKYSVRNLAGYFGLQEMIFRDFPDRFKTVDEARDFSIKTWNSHESLLEAEAISGAPELARHFKRKNIVPFRITSRPGDVLQTTLNWYQQKMPDVDITKILVQNGGSSINMNFKVDTIKNNNIDIHFEDSIDHALAVVENTKARVVLIPQPWNTKFIKSGDYDKKRIIAPISDWRTPNKLSRVYLHLGQHI